MVTGWSQVIQTGDENVRGLQMYTLGTAQLYEVLSAQS